ncbi:MULTISPECIES: hypothetical protein [unclassified Variovorax]|uniref:hypothetical protein n=1 Tax=unclassified Variovorax TaxID=663243 RepID=UPI00076D92D8|nr:MULTISPECIES: hypothetical protein [unclassified Variovorax]KWT72245.1 hypothetical protein APY03_6270 [Variovorax sp. WDL1]PNG53193.1 hypothetical protein CHC06_04538 [Variovorax sp. B2]PNG53765.1 hypothetical protein CHC07_03585 [Variovorax sp. B4]VTV11218.1 hypothetical protein WDL1CHR_02099 [Variovorax sp. WDL1]
MTMFENNQTNSKNSKGRGGARKNAGRKTGSATKKTREIADKAAEEGLTPLEVMLQTMRALVGRFDTLQKAARTDDERAAVPLDFMIEASGIAKDAAPYIHPRLAAIEHSGEIKTRSLAEELAELNGAQSNTASRPPVA